MTNVFFLVYKSHVWSSFSRDSLPYLLTILLKLGDAKEITTLSLRTPSQSINLKSVLVVKLASSLLLCIIRLSDELLQKPVALVSPEFREMLL